MTSFAAAYRQHPVWRDSSITALLFGVSLAVRALIVLPTGFDGLYGQDSFAYYDFARELQTYLRTGQAPGPFFWPVGYPLTLALAFSLFGANAHVGQVISLTLGALLTPLTYILARQTGSGRPGALAVAALMTACGQALQSSMVLMADIPALAWTVLSAVALCRYVDTDRRRWLVISALTLSLAGISRWLSFALVFPWGLGLVITWWGRFGLRKHLLDVAVAGCAALIVFMPQAAYSRLNLSGPFQHPWVQDWSLAHAFQSSFDTVDGQYEFDQINAVFYALPLYDAYYLAPLFAPFVLVGMWTASRRRRASSVMLLGWLLLPYLFMVGMPYQNIRFPLIVFPPVAVLAGSGLEAATAWLRRMGNSRQISRVGYLLMGAILVIALGHTYGTSRQVINEFIARHQSDKEVVRWVAGLVPDGARVYTFNLTLTFQHYSSLDVRDLYFETPDSLAQFWERGKDDFLIVDVYNVERQWQGLAPQIAYDWLRNKRGLLELGQKTYYTLFQIEG